MNQLDLSKLPVPDVIETIDYETEFAAVLERYRVLMGDDWTATVQSDPVMKLLQDVAYEKITLRARVNAAAKAVLLASANGADLDHVLSLVGAERLDGESNDAFRERGRLAPYGFSTAGPGNAYRYHALSAHDDVLDVWVDSPEPGVVRVTVLSRSGQGVPGDEVLAAVRERLNAEDVRPLSDTVLVEPAQVVLWELIATLHFPSGAATEPAVAAAHVAAEAYATASRRLNRPLRRSMLIAALGVSGVIDVELSSLADDIPAGVQVAPFCTAIKLTSVVDYG
ncbi:baseplate J/gp47 family protein [Pseudomonas sp. 21LCFQ02]|uniref:baseplate assembly protein n=1 Tax=Pseudomonas sp. 21LCFQ02 TaxID=2957505 RepID=UPI00209B50A2|nr:baseplate J/gp47 family protein [Pseudomonas sp. 21LCFQ02]MCO8167869.1 baseplate J/gp47 family protein [Pseudomonas sp. 21LCFQ02]